MPGNPNLTIRLAPSKRAILEDAARASGLSLAEFIRRSALEAAAAAFAQLALAEDERGDQ